MTAVFADTTFYVAVLNPRDSLHSAASNWAAQVRRNTVTTEFVLLETANFFKLPADRRRFADLVEHLTADATTTIIPCDAELFRRGMRLYRERADKEWSLTDCISFVVMDDRGIADALTADRHFQQAGYAALLLA